MSLNNLARITAFRSRYIKPFRFIPGHRGGKRGSHNMTLCEPGDTSITMFLVKVWYNKPCNMEQWFTLTGTIDPGVVGQTIVYLQDQLFNSATNPISKLTFFISSLGGDIDSAIRLYDYLTALPFPVDTVGFGQIYSAGVTIYLAGQERFALKKTKFLIHEGIYTIGQPSAPMHLHNENLTILKELGKRNAEILSERSGKTAANIQTMMKEVKVLSADQAKSAGFVTTIIDKLPIPPVPQTPHTPTP